MKAVAWVLGLASVLTVETHGVEIGEHISQVRRELGQPKGYLRMESLELLYYDRGRIECRDGVVVDMDLMSPEELAAKREAEALRRERARRAAEKRRVRMAERGQALKTEKLNSPAFLGGSAADQLSFWTAFRKRYPAVDVEAEFAETLQRYEHELALQRAALERERERAAMEHRLLALERRVLDAETRARNAEDVAYDSRRDQATRFYYPATVVTPVLRRASTPACRSHTGRGSSLQVSIGGQVLHTRGDVGASHGDNCRTTVFPTVPSRTGITVTHTRCEPVVTQSTAHAAFRAQQRAHQASARRSFRAAYSGSLRDPVYN